MFEVLSEKFDSALRTIRGVGRIRDENIEETMRSIRMALLEADVHFRVVKSFVESVREKAMGEKVLRSVKPGDQFVAILNEELIRLLGGTSEALAAPKERPLRILLAGLQGSGKTTTAAKLAVRLGPGGTGLAALDLKRPAAIEQLRILSEEVGARFIPPADPADAPASAKAAVASARAEDQDLDTLVLDSAGRTQIDDSMMEEIRAISSEVQPDETLLVLDAMTGQEAVKVAEAFNDALDLTGVIFTKMDGDARGGAAVSIRALLDLPIKFVGTGEKTDALEPFRPEGAASRILGMGDVVSAVEKAMRTVDEDKARRMARQVEEGRIDLELFLDQIREMRKMGPIEELVASLPGGMKIPKSAIPDEGTLSKFEAIIFSMNASERCNPGIIDGSRRRRIARGSGTTPREVNQLLKQFRESRRMIKAITGKGKGLRGISRLFGMR